MPCAIASHASHLQNFVRNILKRKVTCIPAEKEGDITSHNISVDNYKLHYKRAGTGPVTILCLPGALGSSESDFGPQLHALPDSKVNLVAWDPPGYGDSRPPDRHFSHDFLHKDAHIAAKLMQCLDIPQYGVLGWSDGGITALIMASCYPAAVNKLAVWGANAYVDNQDIEIYRNLRDVSSWSPRMRASLEAVYGCESFRTIWEAWIDTLVDIYRDKGGDLCREELPRITCPSLIMHGCKDTVAPLSHAYYLKEHIRGARLHLFQDGKHNLHLKYADEFNKIVKQFFLEAS